VDETDAFDVTNGGCVPSVGRRIALDACTAQAGEGASQYNVDDASAVGQLAGCAEEKEAKEAEAEVEEEQEQEAEEFAMEAACLSGGAPWCTDEESGVAEEDAEDETDEDDDDEMSTGCWRLRFSSRRSVALSARVSPEVRIACRSEAR